MPSYPRIQITTAPTLDATVLYDLTATQGDGLAQSVATVLRTNFSLGELDLEGDPDAVGVDWALQRITLTQAVQGKKPAAMARLQGMARALLRRRFWVLFQLSASTAPVWWHAYRTAPGELSLENVYADDGTVLPDQWEIAGGIDIDPFSYAARVTQFARTVGNDPASGSPASGVALQPVRGDAPTRLRVKITPSTSERMPSRWLVACIASDRATPILRSGVGTSDGLTAGANTSPANSDTRAIGGSTRSVNFGSGGAPTNQMIQALSGTFPAGGAPAGQYQVLVRVQPRNSVATSVAMQIRSPSGVPLTPTAVARFPLVARSELRTWQWLSLGVVGINDSLPTDVSTGLAQRSLALWMSSSIGTLVDIDDIMFVPVSGRGIDSATCLVVESTGAVGAVGPSATVPLNIDGDDEVKWLPGAQEGDYTLTDVGGFPEADPGAANNVLLVMPLQAETQTNYGGAMALGATAQVEVSLYPRSAWLGDGVA